MLICLIVFAGFAMNISNFVFQMPRKAIYSGNFDIAFTFEIKSTEGDRHDDEIIVVTSALRLSHAVYPVSHLYIQFFDVFCAASHARYPV